MTSRNRSCVSGRAGSTLTLRNLPGVSAQRVVLVGLGKQEEYSARAHASAEQAFAAECTEENWQHFLAARRHHQEVAASETG